MPLLVRTPAPYPHESLFGYVLRISETNGCHNPRIILGLAECGRGFTQLPMPGLPIKKLAAVLGRSESELKPIAYKADADVEQFKLLAHDLGGQPVAYLNYRSPVVCPRCVTEEKHISAFWDLSMALACPRHAVVPLTKCCTCGQPLRWNRQGLSRCHCGAELRHEWCEPADAMTVKLMQLLEAKLTGDPLEDVGAAGYPLEWMKEVSLRGLLDALRLFGKHLDSNPRVDGAEPMNIASVLANWPQGYHRFLRSIGERSLRGSPETAGLGKQFWGFYSPAFRSSTSSQELEFLRRELVAFGLTDWGRGSIDKRLRDGETLAQPRFVSKTAFARTHRLNTPTLNRMIRDGDVVAVRTKPGRGGRTIIDTEASKTPTRVQADDWTISGRDAAKQVGLPVAVMKALRREGTLACPLRTGKGGTWYAADVDRFVSKAAAVAREFPSHVDGVSLDSLMRLKFRDAKAKAHLLAAALDGTLTPIGRESVTVGGLQFSKSDVGSLVLETRVASAGGTRSLPQAADACGISPDVMPSAIDQGLLVLVKVGGIERVTAESVENFVARYTPLVRLASDLHTTVRPLGNVCTDLGVEVIGLRRSNGRPAQPMIQSKDVDAVSREYRERTRLRATRTFSGRAENQVRALQTYINGLAAEGHVLPRRGAQPNKSVIAQACGFDRSVLVGNQSCAALLAERDRLELSLGEVRSSRQRLKCYLIELRERGAPLPRWKGLPNKLQIARACGFDRSAFDTEPGLLELLHPTPGGPI